jgi:hypothetical protein
MNIEDYKTNIEKTEKYIDSLLFHKETLTGDNEMLKPIFEYYPLPLRNMTDNADVTPIIKASKDIIEARKTYYYNCMELLQVDATIIAQTELLNSYKAHVQQELTKQAKPCTDEMIYDAFTQAKKLNNLSYEEKGALKGIAADLSKILNSGKERRVELYETLQNIIVQHK